MYLEKGCAVKLGDRHPEKRWCKGCNLCCAVPGLSLLDRQVKSLHCADDLVPLSPTEQGLQQQLDTVEKVLPELGPGSKCEEN